MPVCTFDLLTFVGHDDVVLSQVEMLRAVTDCVCSGDVVTYECNVCGGNATVTVWSGSGFQCASNEIILSHRDFEGTGSESGVCNNREIVGQIEFAENECYLSQLNVTFNDQLQDSTVICSVDNGTFSSEIGRKVLRRSTGMCNIVTV